ncbi:translocation protein SEC62 [Trichogramma pretiosum]|uniref:translocation protein SEC62 n=1 Tax=Trichogramma pretiosum TaxID=7493 RepID=UPI0006C9D2D0|nr:translocation protein SEC62 [Trichogramma pretiosum]
MVTERKKTKKRKDDALDSSANDKNPTKEEYLVAKWIRANVPSKKTKFDRNHMVEYFTGTRAVDALLERSPWNKTIFETRQQVVDYLEIMLRHKFFHRAKKIIISEDELKQIKNLKKRKNVKNVKDETCSEKNDDANAAETINDNVSKVNEGKDNRKFENASKKKPKVRLEMHMDQYFVDCNDAYVWIYDPIPFYYWFFGTLLVLGAIGVCLFPLWPLTVRHGVWYLSVAAAGFLVFILSLLIVRSVVFCLLWVLTLGRHHLWLFPNLIEDVGFFASFWPIYDHQCFSSNDGDTMFDKSKQTTHNKLEAENVKTLKESTQESNSSKPSQMLDEKSYDAPESSDGQGANEENMESDRSNSEDFEML